MANKKINELQSRVPSLSDLMLVGDPSSGYSFKCTVTDIANIVETDIGDAYVTLTTTQSISGAKTFSNILTLTSVTNASVDTDKFLVLNASNVVNFRTGAEVLSDIGAAAASSISGTAGQVAYFTGTNSVGGSNNLFWDNANARLGIGTNAPTNKLHISYTGLGGIALQSTSIFSYLYNDATNFIVASTSGTTGYKFYVNLLAPDNSMYIQQNGYVYIDRRLGIGTASPNNLLHLYNASSVAAALQTTGGYAYFSNDGTNVYLATDKGSTGQKFYFALNAPDNALNIKSNGNTIIGSATDAGFRLDVNGTARVSGLLTLNNSITTTIQTFTLQGQGSVQFYRMNNSTGYTTISDNVGVGISGQGTNLYYLLKNKNANSYSTIIANEAGLTTSSAVENSAALEIRSTTGGFLQSRMTTVQRDAITSPATGLSIYNTTTNTMDYYNGSAWVSTDVGSGANGQVAYWTGTNTQSGSATFTFSPTSQLLLNNSVTAASAIARGMNVTSTLTAAANNDVLVGLDINPTFTNGAFTGVQNFGLRYTQNVNGENFIVVRNTNAGTFAGGGLLLQNDIGTIGGIVTYSSVNASTNIRNNVVVSTGGAYDILIGTNLSVGSGGTGNIKFQTGGVNASQERMRIFSNGNIGINTTTDAGFRLDVNGTARVQSTITVGTSALIGTESAIFTTNNAGGNAFIRVYNSGVSTTGSQAGIVFTNNIAGNASSQIFAEGIDVNGNTNLKFLTSSSYSATEKMRINNNGNVGIGTTTIGSRLQVNGGAAIGYSASTTAPTNGLQVAGATTLNDLLTVTPPANVGAIKVDNFSLTGSDQTTMVSLAGTWNTTGNPTALKLNITNTASGAGADLMELQVGGVNQFLVTKDGAIQTSAPSGGTAANWKLGSKVASSVVLDDNDYLEVEVGGVAYRVALVNLA